MMSRKNFAAIFQALSTFKKLAENMKIIIPATIKIMQSEAQFYADAQATTGMKRGEKIAKAVPTKAYATVKDAQVRLESIDWKALKSALDESNELITKWNKDFGDTDPAWRPPEQAKAQQPIKAAAKNTNKPIVRLSEADRANESNPIF